MLRKIMFWGIFLIILVNSVNAQTQKELADQHYELALYSYDNGDCKNASVHVGRALDLYTQISDIFGRNDCKELIVQINSCLSSEGDSYYIQALDYHSRGEGYLGSGDYGGAKEEFDTALLLIYDANSSYQYMIPVDAEKIERVDMEYLNITGKIEESELMRADGLYRTSEGYFDAEDIMTAKKFAEDALDVYTQYGNDDGINKTQKLIRILDDEIASQIIYADYLYEKGVDDYKGANCTNDGYFSAIDNFEEAKGRYGIVGKTERMQDCDANIGQINERIEDCANRLREQANQYYDDADEHRRLRECTEALEDANEAKSLFQMVYKLTGSNNDKKRIDDCDNLLRRIRSECKIVDELEEARGYLANATELFKVAEYGRADELLEKAMEIFERHEDYEGLTNARRLRDDIAKMLDRITDADDYYNRSLTYYDVADYENATIYLEKARGLYVSAGLTQEVATCDSKLEDVRDGNETKNEADRYYEEALAYFESSDYDLSRDYAADAKGLYESINHAEGVKKAEELLGMIPDGPITLTQFIILPLTLVVVFLIVIAWNLERVRLKKEEKDTEERKRREVEEKKRAEMEAEMARREREREELDEERKRLRDMLVEEKKKVE
jgi:hypothetical protein